MSEQWSSRKLWAAIGLVVLATWMRWAGLLSEAGWIQMIQLSIGGYFVANVGQKAVLALATVLAKPKEPVGSSVVTGQ